MQWKTMASACVLAVALVGIATPAKAQVEPILGYLLRDDGLHVQVQSGGCTSAESFRVDVSDGAATLTRVVPDACAAELPWGTPVVIPWAALGLADPYGEIIPVLTNPIATHGAFIDGPVSWTFGPMVPGGHEGTEALFGYIIDESGVTFQVLSGGCTSRDSFRIDHQGAFFILTRITPDYCEAEVGLGIEVTYGAAELGIDAMAPDMVLIANPLSTHAAFRSPALPPVTAP